MFYATLYLSIKVDTEKVFLKSLFLLVLFGVFGFVENFFAFTLKLSGLC